MQDTWIWILALWVPIAGITAALCLYDLTGGDVEAFPEARQSRPSGSAEKSSADTAYRDSLD